MLELLGAATVIFILLPLWSAPAVTAPDIASMVEDGLEAEGDDHDIFETEFELVAEAPVPAPSSRSGRLAATQSPSSW